MYCKKVLKKSLFVVLLMPLLLSTAVYAQNDDQDTIKMNIAEGLVLASSVKVALVEDYVNQGKWPEGTDEQIKQQLALQQGISADYTKQVRILPNGVIEVEYDEKVLGGGKKLFLIPDASSPERITWRCQSGEGAGAIQNNYLPMECRK